MKATYVDFADLDAAALREAALVWQRQQAQPGIYRVYVSPDGSISNGETFSGDNSWIPGDDRITILYADIREHLSNEVLGLDEDGDFADSETLASILDEAERRYNEALAGN